LPEVWFAVPGDPESLTGGYIYAKRLTQALEDLGWQVHRLRLPAGFPNPSPAELTETRRILDGVPRHATALIDGLAFGAFTPAVLAQSDLDSVALVHHPLARETGLTPEAIAAFTLSERAALSTARAVIATSPHTADVLAADYGVSTARLFVAPPGSDPHTRAHGTPHRPNLLTVATVTPRKGHDILVAALEQIADLPWASTLAGSLTRAPETVAALRRQIAGSGVADRIVLSGELSAEALATCYAGADIFVLPSRYEGYGMVFAEALSYGLPIVGCAAGAVAGTVPAETSILVPTDDASALAGALRGLLSNSAARIRLADAAWIAGQRLPQWTDTAMSVANVLGNGLKPENRNRTERPHPAANRLPWRGAMHL
jgi:glycosyltransferase involved in cell wall biosynthesis